MRRAAKGVREVTNSQILDVNNARPLPPVPPTLRDLLTIGFFAEGSRQEQEGVFKETENVPIRSLDRVPRRWWPLMLALFVVVSAAFVGGYWLVLRGEWYGLIAP